MNVREEKSFSVPLREKFFHLSFTSASKKEGEGRGEQKKGLKLPALYKQNMSNG